MSENKETIGQIKTSMNMLGSLTYFNPYWLALRPSLPQASCSTSANGFDGFVFIVALLAVESITTTCELMISYEMIQGAPRL
jgi:hypothetical protein